MKEIKLSFIIPVYNAGKYIEKCIESIINQTYDNFEIILVDDGSKDNSYELISRYAFKFNKIVAITQENGGPSKARNRGIELATGDYLAFVDVDDYLDESFAERMVEKAYTGKSDLVVCNYTEINSLGTINVTIFNTLKANLVEDNDICLAEVLKGPGGIVWGKLFKRSIIEKKNLRFDENYKMCEDLLFCIEYIKEVKFSSRCNEYLYIHNKCNESSITAKYTLDMFYKQVEIQEKIKDILKNNNIYSEDKKALLNERFKDILQYSIEREFSDKNRKKLKEKIININKVILNENIKGYINQIQGNGPIDKTIVKAIKKGWSIRLYLVIKLRALVVEVYSKASKMKGEKFSEEA